MEVLRYANAFSFVKILNSKKKIIKDDYILHLTKIKINGCRNLCFKTLEIIFEKSIKWNKERKNTNFTTAGIDLLI